MILINFVWIFFFHVGLIAGNLGKFSCFLHLLYSDPITFLVSNSFGQLSLESLAHTRVLVDGLIAPNAFDYSFNDKLVFYVGGHQIQHTDFISVIKVRVIYLLFYSIGL